MTFSGGRLHIHSISSLNQAINFDLFPDVYLDYFPKVELKDGWLSLRPQFLQCPLGIIIALFRGA